MLLGTAPYMSPEQARGKTVDKRADNWAFGCCLYEALTGAPFLRETVAETLGKIVERDPDWESLPRSTPTRLRELLRRGLKKDPRYRLQAIGEARIEIEEAQAKPSTPSPTTSRDARADLAPTSSSGLGELHFQQASK